MACGKYHPMKKFIRLLTIRRGLSPWLLPIIALLACFGLVTEAATAAEAPPQLHLNVTSISFTDASADGLTQKLTITNTGEGQLRWSATTNALWLNSGPYRVVDAILGNSTQASGLGPGQSVEVTLTAQTQGLKPDTYGEFFSVTSNGGVAKIPLTLTVSKLNLNGQWVGAFTRPDDMAVSSPGLALNITQTDATLKAQIDGRLSPAFATSIKRQAGKFGFENSEGSLSGGQLNINSVKESTVAEDWTLTALDSATFDVQSSVSGVKTQARVGEPFNSDTGGLSFTILPSKNNHPYQRGDRFLFEVGHFGYVETELNGSLEAGLSGTSTLDGKFFGIPEGVTRSLRIYDFTLEKSNVLIAKVEMRHTNLLNGKDMVTSKTVRLVRAQ